ncbi:MAG: NADH-quinone oxidoreductase subunit L [Helicobacteraceae bacterium]|nr:NADH-quinone oxidoreductase subunit L [Helicobacteraceae bacterium]
MSTLLLLVVFLPFLSALVLGLTYLFDTHKRVNEKFYTILGVAVPILVTILSFVIVLDLMSHSSTTVVTAVAFNWLSIDSFHIDLAFVADPLSAVMISFITFIGTLIHIYAAAYMSSDQGFGKFFSYFNLFLGSMLLLVLASNPIIMFIGWELVGLVSYLLIGFYNKEYENVTAANKAFIVNRVGDFGFIIGLGILFVAMGDNGFTFADIKENIYAIDNHTLTLVGIFLFIGAMGKSAQIPLYVWLPDAMAGPTPVSALIHAATMVTAGVYMVARFSFLYNEIPQVGEFIAIIGVSSALFAAIIASYQSDIKKILAYSTMSQLGYMFVAVGLGAYSAGIFHVFTHAFFKALLFMGAGAVIIALHHEQNIFKMGSLKKALPLVYITMFIATLAISGIPPFAGFFSKDAILNHAFMSEHYTIWVLGVITAFLTAFYMFRMLFIVFVADMKNNHIEHKALSKALTYPLIVLAIGATFAGFLGANEAYGGSDLFKSFISLNDINYSISHSTEYMLGFVNVLVSLLGVTLAYKYFRTSPQEPLPNKRVRTLIINKFYVDELYDRLFVQNLRSLSNFFNKTVDEKLIDGFINNVVHLNLYVASKFTSLQNGKIQHYSIYLLSGVSMMSLLLIYILEVR